MKLILAAACAALAFGPAASAQDAPAPSPATLVEEVEVIARLPGPALWRVSTPTSQIWLMVMPAQGPEGFRWDQRRVTTALDGAREFVLPPAGNVGLVEGVSLLVLDTRHLIHMPPGQTVRGRMAPDLRARWEDAARASGADPAQYDHWRPVLAALALTGDANRHAKLKGVGVLALAIKMHVKVHGLATYKVMDVVKSVPSTPEQAERDCLVLAADGALSMQEEAPKLVQAWARGDLVTLRAHRNPSAECFAQIPGVAALNARAAADWAKELKADLVKPGKVVVGTDLDTMTRKGGLLDQLKAEGLEVIGPAWD